MSSELPETYTIPPNYFPETAKVKTSETSEFPTDQFGNTSGIRQVPDRGFTIR